MNYLIQVQKGIDFIETNLDFDISIEDIAKQAGISRWHFQRIFKALTKETLKSYIRSRRLANALPKLLSTNQRIIDIALTAGYESQESFSRSFRKVYQLNPNEYRKLGKKNQFVTKVQFNEQYLRHINQSISLTPIIYQQPSMTMAGVKTLFYSDDSEKNNISEKLPPLWASFIPRMDEIPYRIGDKAYGVITTAQQKDSELLEYYAAVAVSNRGTVPEGMVYFELEAASYAKFKHIGYPERLDDTVNYIYSNWLMRSDYQHNYGADLEIYGDQYRPDSADSIVEYAIPLIRSQ